MVESVVSRVGSIEWSYPELPVNIPYTRDFMAALTDSTYFPVLLCLGLRRKYVELLDSFLRVRDCRRIRTDVARKSHYSLRERRGMRRIQ